MQRSKMGDAWNNEFDIVFTDETGKDLTHVTVYNCFKRFAAQIGSPTTRFQDLRHSYAVAAIQSGDDIKTVQGNLGHATASFTLDVYGHVSEQMEKNLQSEWKSSSCRSTMHKHTVLVFATKAVSINHIFDFNSVKGKQVYCRYAKACNHCGYRLFHDGDGRIIIMSRKERDLSAYHLPIPQVYINQNHILIVLIILIRILYSVQPPVR